MTQSNIIMWNHHSTKIEYVSIWNRFTKATETRKICTTGWEVVPHIDHPTARKVRMTELKHRCLLSVGAYMDVDATVIELWE